MRDGSVEGWAEGWKCESVEGWAEGWECEMRTCTCTRMTLSVTL